MPERSNSSLQLLGKTKRGAGRKDRSRKGEFDKALRSAEKALDLDPANQNAVKLRNLAAQMKPHALQ